MRKGSLRALASFLDSRRAPVLSERYASHFREDEAAARDLAVSMATAFPALEPLVTAQRELFIELSREGIAAPRERASLLGRFFSGVGTLLDGDLLRVRLRRAVTYEKLRIAARELLPSALGGADFDVTSAELSSLAEAAIEVALAEASLHVAGVYGEPRTASGQPSRFVVIGMGKLGGRELNAGSDIDLLYFYDTDEGETAPPDGGPPRSLHEHWSRVARRLTETLDGMGEGGRIWRTDLRLRPEGSGGPITCSVASAERYYESFGRLWERSALLRARPVAGCLELGGEALRLLRPFIYTRRVDPSLAIEMIRLVERGRAELCREPSRDLKLGRGGIREAETFVQALQLVFGGKEPRIRSMSTLDALSKLAAVGLVTEREAGELADAYRFLRCLEHRIQWATGLQTHLLPEPGEARERLSRSMGYDEVAQLEADLQRARARIRERFDSLAPTPSVTTTRWDEVLSLLDEADEAAISAALGRAFAQECSLDLARDVRRLARRPDDLLGGKTRENFPELAPTLLQALADAADPEQAVRYLRMWTTRLNVPSAYIRPLGEDPRALRRLVGVLGASVFLGQAIANRPELGESVIFSRTPPTPELVRETLENEISALPEHARAFADDFVGALRRSAWISTIEIALADWAGEIDVRDTSLALSALADETLERTTRFVMGSPDAVRGLALIAIGTLGSNELGFGSDLDVLFVFDPKAAPSGLDPHAYFARQAQKIIRLVSSPHAEGRGYELDARLRPSGNQGLLVTSLDSFARYHGVALEASDGASASPSGAFWERLSLVRARFCAGDAAIGVLAMQIAERAAYEREAPSSMALHRLRMRMQKELGRERPGRYDLKHGAGGLLDIQLAVQLLQVRNGQDPRVRTSETWIAIASLQALGYLRADLAEAFRSGYRFLRRLEQRIRIVHGSSAHLLDEEAEGLVPLARRMGFVDGGRGSAADQLIQRYREVTIRVRRAYLEVLGVKE